MANLMEMDVKQGFNFDKTVQKSFGYVTKLKIGDKQFTPDLDIKNTPDGPMKVVGVLKTRDWEQGVTDPVVLKFQVSTASKQDMVLLKLKEMTKNQVEYDLVIFDFDSVAQQFFRTFHTQDTMMKGTVQKSGRSFIYDIAEYVSTEVDKPDNYLAMIGIDPQGEQNFHVAGSIGGKVTKQWGMNN